MYFEGETYMMSFWKEMFKIMKFLFFRSEDWPEFIVGVSEISNGQCFFTKGSFGHYSFNLPTKQ